jgi:hypothetical protein
MLATQNEQQKELEQLKVIFFSGVIHIKSMGKYPKLILVQKSNAGGKVEQC